MKRSAFVFSAILVFLCAATAGASPAPDSVIMPWESFDALRNRVADTPAERSARFAYEKALYKGVAEVKKDEYHIRFTADVIVNTFGDTEILVPFLSRQLNLESLTVDGVQSTWTETGEFFLAMIPEAGRHEVRSEFIVILDANRWPRNVYLVYGHAGRDVIPESIKLTAGRTGQEYNIRKKRCGAFWQDRYHETAVESGEHPVRRIVYIDLNMVRAGIVKHPSQWTWSGYNEIKTSKKNGAHQLQCACGVGGL